MGRGERYRKGILMRDTLSGIKSTVSVKVVSEASLADLFTGNSELIARRAYEIFENDGHVPGRDLEHWFRAETELFHPVHVEVTDLDYALALHVEMPSYRAEQLEVSIAPRRVSIIGKREMRDERSKKNKIIYADHCSDRIFRTLELPVEIDTSKATATFRDGALELILPKVAETEKTRTASHSA